MEEEEWTAFFFTANEEFCQLIIFFLHPRQIFFFDRIFSRIFPYYWFHRYSRESLIQHIFYICGEVQVVLGKGAAHIIFFPISMGYAVLKILHNLVIGAFSMDARTHAVMHFLPTIQRKDEADMVISEVFDLFFIKEHAIGGERHLNFLMMFLFLFVYIINSLLHHVPVHQRFTTKEIQFAVFSRTTMGNQEIYAPASHIKAHEHTPFPIATLPCKAVFTAKVAVMGNINAQGFNDRTVFDGHLIVRIHRCKQYLLLDEIIQIIHDFIQFCCIIIVGQIGQYHIPIGPIIISQYLISHIIHHVNDTAIHVHNNIHSILLESVNHGLDIVIHEIYSPLLYTSINNVRW